MLGHNDAVSCVAKWNPRNWQHVGKAISGSFDHTIRTWSQTGKLPALIPTPTPTSNPAPGESLHVFTGHSGPVRCVVGIGDFRFASGSEDKSVKVLSRFYHDNPSH